GGIRTLDTLLAYTHFPGERLRPLGHRSAFPWKGGQVEPRRKSGNLAAFAVKPLCRSNAQLRTAPFRRRHRSDRESRAAIAAGALLAKPRRRRFVRRGIRRRRDSRGDGHRRPVRTL